MDLYQQEHLTLKPKLPSKNILYIATRKSDKKNYQPRNYRGISENIFFYHNGDHIIQTDNKTLNQKIVYV